MSEKEIQTSDQKNPQRDGEDSPKAEVSVPVKVRLYPLLERAVEEGIALGWNRAHKHADTPNEARIKEEIERAIMSELSELFDFGN